MTGKISDDPDAGPVTGSEKLACVSGGANKYATPAEIAAYIASLAQTLVNKTINAASNALSNIDLSMFAAGVVDTDGTLAANSDTRMATQKAVKAYADALIGANDAMVFKGVIDCSANPNYPASDRGWTWKVSVAGKIGGGSGVNVEIGDLLICITDGTASGTQAGVGASWSIIQANIDGAVTGPASAVSARIAIFSGTSGKVVADGGAAISTDGTFAANSDAKVPTEKAVKTYVDGGAWTAYTPTVGSGSGALTTAAATGRYRLVGKTCLVEMAITITTNGTGATFITATLPFAAQADSFFGGKARAVSGKLVGSTVQATGSTLAISNYDNSYPGASGEIIVISGEYETT